MLKFKLGLCVLTHIRVANDRFGRMVKAQITVFARLNGINGTQNKSLTYSILNYFFDLSTWSDQNNSLTFVESQMYRTYSVAYWRGREKKCVPLKLLRVWNLKLCVLIHILYLFIFEYFVTSVLKRIHIIIYNVWNILLIICTIRLIFWNCFGVYTCIHIVYMLFRFLILWRNAGTHCSYDALIIIPEKIANSFAQKTIIFTMESRLYLYYYYYINYKYFWFYLYVFNEYIITNLTMSFA